MADKMTVVGQDGKPRYELAPDNTITDLRDHCTCDIIVSDGDVPYQINGEQRVCLVCGLPITQKP